MAAVLLTTSAFAQARGVTFTPIGFREDPGPYPASNILAMNPQGTTFVASPSFQNFYGTLWTREDGWGQDIGVLQPSVRIASDGTIMTNGYYPASNPGYLWPGTWRGLPNEFDPIPESPNYKPCDGRGMGVSDMSPNAAFATGSHGVDRCRRNGFLWERATDTTITLGTPDGSNTTGSAVTNDGRVVFGSVTSLAGPPRGAFWENGTWTFLGDPNGTEPKICITTGKPCTANYGDPLYGCPEEFVDDGTCPASSKGTCTAGVCAGGFDAGKKCTATSQCGGTCSGGPNAGQRCTVDSSCPDSPVCVANPAWTDDLWKGQVFDATPEGEYAVGRHFDYGTKWDAGFRLNPDGTFTEIPLLPDFPFLVNATRISDNGLFAAGYAGGPLFGFAPIVWNEWIGTVDLQKFLIGQGLDELYFWYLISVNAISEDGLLLGGQGVNPDGLLEGFLVDLHRIVICHKEADPESPAYPTSGQTTGIAWRELGEHITHGDELGSCEYLESGGLARADALRQQLVARHAALVENGTLSVDPAAYLMPDVAPEPGKKGWLVAPVSPRSTGALPQKRDLRTVDTAR